MKSELLRKMHKVKKKKSHIPFFLFTFLLPTMSVKSAPLFVKEFCHSPTGSHLLTVVAYDRDKRGTPNSTFHYEIKSVSPNPPDTEFFIDESGTISFKGCLDHEARE